MCVGVINLSVEFEDSYSEALRQNDNPVVLLTSDNFEKGVSECDGVIICEDSAQDTARTCSILLKLKETSDVSVWVLSSNLQKVIKTVYLKLGALDVLLDDYEAEDLALIVSNSLNKIKTNQSCEVEEPAVNDDDSSSTKGLRMIPRNHSVKIDGRKEIPLTRLEYKTMELLYRFQNNTVTYEELFESIWGEGFNNHNYRVANLIFHLRGKLEDDAVNPMLIRTVRSKGYMLDLKD
ncbi:response regulator transcription factor [Enterococcus sp. BWM-S5]|uniref:Response regulator transcription factor n=1 Tax=Enterococcus larvae TaxID=2794352 RepID=A0ABS4CJV4_9ENTE|nr:winged helix-turn-helix domain-containing protein [Enterococcus larvae]MBP1046738.1 response regulator transcription factor [Enterococcus larvae]